MSESPTPSAVPAPLDLSQPRRVHIVGVAGAGMSAIALVLARMGHTVSGSDIKNAAVLERLRAAGVEVHVENRAEHVPADADAVIYSTAIPLRNVELVAAAEQGIPVLHRSAALHGFFWSGWFNLIKFIKTVVRKPTVQGGLPSCPSENIIDMW